MSSFGYNSIIWLTQGKYSIVDNEDYDRASFGMWHYSEIRKGAFYAKGRISGKGESFGLHRYIMNAQKGQIIDHINGNTLDNRKANLRACTRSGNQANRKLGANNTSDVKGVSWEKRMKCWKAKVKYNNVRYESFFKDKIQAAKWYDNKAVELHGEFALTNKMMGLI